MTQEPETVAVVGGTGDQGFGLALRWAKAGRHVLIGSRVRARAEEAAAKVKAAVGNSARVEGSENADVVARATLVVLSVPFEAQIATLKAVRTAWRPGQILVDLTVPLEASFGGSPTRVLKVWAGSAAEQAAQHVPENISVVGAFHNIGAHALQEIQHEVECDVIVCGDNAEARGRVRPWVEAIPGCRYVDGGKLENARIVESLTALLIGINRRYKVPGAGLRITGLPH
ncbi:MAG: NADPH-dependent F420 reductase [Acidobacteria bacterium]|nr:NADPH-dependent F420 reductase [Acidobacteriota bacterium]